MPEPRDAFADLEKRIRERPYFEGALPDLRAVAVRYGRCSTRQRLVEALRELTMWAEAARGHYGIEECSGPGQPSTEWDEVQDGLRSAAMFARAVLAEFSAGDTNENG